MSVIAIRRKYLLRLLAEIDQQVAGAECLAFDQWLTARERRHATARVAFLRNAVVRVEWMLDNIHNR